MIDHVELFTERLDASADFFEKALAPLGYRLHVHGAVRGFGVDNDSLDFWLREGGPSTPLPHVAFHCADRALVDAAYQAALAGGGRDRAAPALLPQIHPNYYAGFVYDPDGHNIEFVCHRAEAA
ncbi:VOC family protein [Tahibacter amnicola]|uniref:VOC family protein n=1 Tax=Tahibacter amnicola TaxID=2976241 RepID=A0ABY6BGB5_9GAMM|nr:VOC family protein [Tahibacter amnicola]UXI68557.1 VOC family protein [Tahibacter amnicola]